MNTVDDEPRWLVTPEQANAAKARQQPASKPQKRTATNRSKVPGKLRTFNRFWRHADTCRLSRTAQSVWSYLWGLSDAQRTCYPSMGRIAARVGCSPRQAQRAVAELRRRDYLRVLAHGHNHTGDRRSNVYRVTLPSPVLAEKSQAGKGDTDVV